jgi:photosystem II stability/assembly factor-like uncharacterized protein
MDKGENWKEIYTSATDGPLIVAMKLDKNNPETLYAATSDNLLLKSRDGGGSWRNMYADNAPIIQIETDKNDSNLVYVLNNSGGISRSRDGGDNFEKMKLGNSNRSLSSSGISAIRIDPAAPGVIYAVGNNGISKSSNAGDSWEKLSALNDPKNTPVTSLAVSPKDSQKIIYGAAQAVYNSVDGGVNWATSQFDVKKRINVLEYDPQNSDVVWAGFRK